MLPSSLGGGLRKEAENQRECSFNKNLSPGFLRRRGMWQDELPSEGLRLSFFPGPLIIIPGPAGRRVRLRGARRALLTNGISD